MNKCYTNLFRRLLNAIVLNSLVIYGKMKNEMLNHLKPKVDLAQGWLVKYSAPRGVSDDQDSDTIKRQMERQFARIPPTEKRNVQNKTVCCLQQAQ